MKSDIPALLAIFTLLYVSSCTALTEEELLDENGLCKSDGQFKRDCNSCFCQKGKEPGCTYRMCPPSGGESGAITTDAALDEDGICKENGTFKLDCNTCSCVIGEEPTCTRKACPPTDNQGSGGSITKEEALDSDGYCKIDGKFKLDCNSCSCRVNDKPSCTRKGCPSS